MFVHQTVFLWGFECVNILVNFNLFIILYRFALKKIQYRENDDDDTTRELDILKRLDNKYIVKYHDTFEETCLLCIVTEYCSVSYIF